MASLKTVVIAGLFTSGLALSARAADYRLPPPPPFESEPVVAEIGTGWYLRGDVGYVEYTTPKDRDASPDRPRLRNMEIDPTFSLGGGVGYKFNSWFRADVTGDYRYRSDFSNRSSGSFDRTGVEEGFNIEKGRFETAIVLANAYLDIGSWYGITPYIGAGVGAAERGFTGFHTETFCVQEPTSLPGMSACGSGAPNSFAIGSQGRVNRADYSRWGLAWALMGGASASLGGGFSLDLGYRYVNLGEAESGYDIGDFPDRARTRLKDIDSHEIRFGARYMID